MRLGPDEPAPLALYPPFCRWRQRNSSSAADNLAEMIVNFFQLSTALRPDAGMNYKQRSHLLQRTGLDA
jgi:hypothetical protein